MTSDSFRAISREVGRNFPSFIQAGRLFFLSPVNQLLRGVYFDSSAFSKTSFYPTVFVQPLYKKADNLFFTFGGRLHSLSSNGWEVQPHAEKGQLEDILEALQSEALPFLSLISNPRDLAVANENQDQLPSGLRWSPDDLNVMEAVAYSWYLSGERRKACFYLEEIARDLREEPDTRGWVKSVGIRASNFLILLTEGKDDQALQLLREARLASAQALKLAGHLATDATAWAGSSQ